MKNAKRETIIKMLETLPGYLQNQTIDHLREYITEINDELKWNEAFERTQKKLVQVARKAKEEIKTGKSTIMDFNKL